MKNWEDDLSDRDVIAYSLRPRLIYKDQIIADRFRAHFTCGTGLGLTVIRPFESFSDTLSLSEITAEVSVFDFLSITSDSTGRDKLSGREYNLENYISLPLIVDKMENQDFELYTYFNLPVISYFGNRHSTVRSNRLNFTRNDLLKK